VITVEKVRAPNAAGVRECHTCTVLASYMLVNSSSVKRR
jgi:hypothetical protein